MKEVMGWVRAESVKSGWVYLGWRLNWLIHYYY